MCYNLPQPLVEIVSGFTAGVVTTLAVHPLDLVKTRLQVDRTKSSRFGSSTRIAQQVLREEGGLTAFYRGIAPNLIGNSLSWALYFLWYDRLKNGLMAYHGSGPILSYYDYFLASSAAGMLTAVCTNPIWVIKTRMLSTSSNYAGAYTSILDGTQQIYQADGIPGFYRGLVPSLFGVSHGAIQFVAYEQMKKWRSTASKEGDHELNNHDFVFFSGLSKIFASSATYPYQVIRTRLQTYNSNTTYSNARDVIFQLWRQEGLAGFYKGLGPNLFRVVPSSCVTFLVYENTRAYLPRAIDDGVNRN